MLLKLPIMLCSNAPEFCLLCSNYARQIQTFFLLNDEIMSISMQSFIVPLQYEISITHATIYLYVHIYHFFIVYVYVALWNLNLINT